MKRTIFLLTLLAAVTMSAKAYEVGDWINLDGISYYVRSETEVEVYSVVDLKCPNRNATFFFFRRKLKL